MKVVAIPFKDEDLRTVLANLEIAAAHPAIDVVWGVGSQPEVVAGARAIARRRSKVVEIFDERRVGRYRPGKGDAMNTALLRAADQGASRIHFYDADITNFSLDWIEGAEDAADLGYEVVRHSFPRAATDAMITWFVTRPLLAMRYPGTVLPRIGQPLGGELLLTEKAIRKLAASPEVLSRSDWGIDTLLTFTTVQHGFSLYEHYVGDGKRHALYGSLTDLRLMVVECLDAVLRLEDGDVPSIEHASDAPGAIPDELRAEVGYDVAATVPHLRTPLQDGEAELIASLPVRLADDVHRLARGGDFQWLDADAWERVLLVALDRFQLGDPAWESLFFRLWVGRVVNYTMSEVAAGYDRALAYLATTVSQYEANARQRRA